MADQDLGHAFFVLLVLLCILSYITVSVRCFVRIKILRTFGADDWLLIVSLALFTVMAGLYFTSIHYGIGRPIAAVNPPNLIYILKYYLFGTIAHIICTIPLKFSIGLLLARFAPERWYHHVLRINMALVFATNTTMFLLLVFACRPIHYTWDHRGEGTCVEPSINRGFGFFYSAVNVAADWVFALLPVFMLWNIQMSIRGKVSAIFLLGLGVLASIATAVRLKYSVGVTNSVKDYDLFCHTAIWAVIEVGIGLVAASVVAFRPLFRYFSFREPSTKEDSRIAMDHTSSLNSSNTTVQNSITLPQDE